MRDPTSIIDLSRRPVTARCPFHSAVFRGALEPDLVETRAQIAEESNYSLAVIDTVKSLQAFSPEVAAERFIRPNFTQIAPTTNNPRPGWKQLKDWLKQFEVSQDDQHSQTGLTFNQQLSGEVRKRTQNEMSRLSALVWQEWKPWISQNRLVLAPTILEAANKEAQAPYVASLGFSMRALKIDRDFPRIFGCSNIGQTTLLLRVLLFQTIEHFSNSSAGDEFWLNRAASDEVRALLHTRNMSPAAAISHGFGSAQLDNLNTLRLLALNLARVLAEKNLSFSDFDRQGMEDAAVNFMSEKMDISLGTFSTLMDFCNAPYVQNERDFLDGFERIVRGVEPQTDINGNPHSNMANAYDKKYFKTYWMKSEKSGFPIQDFNPMALTPEELFELSAVGKVFGCPAGKIGIEFTRWLTNTYFTAISSFLDGSTA